VKKGKKTVATEQSAVMPVNDFLLIYDQPLEDYDIPIAEHWAVEPIAAVPVGDSMPNVMVESEHQMEPNAFAHSGVDSQIAIVQSAEVSVIIKNTITYQTSRQLNYEDPSGFVQLSDRDASEKGGQLKVVCRTSGTGYTVTRTHQL
jgi:hypothetical protein